MQNQTPFFLLKIINDKFEARGNNECQKVGLTLSQFRVLIYLDEHAGQKVTQREMELFFKVSHPTICGILKRMEEKKFVSCSIVKDGKQQKYVDITNVGKMALDSIFSSRNSTDEELLKLFTEDELASFNEYLKRIVDYLS